MYLGGNLGISAGLRVITALLAIVLLWILILWAI